MQPILVTLEIRATNHSALTEPACVTHAHFNNFNQDRKKMYTLDICRAFSMIERNFSSDNKELAVLPGATSFFSFNFETATGSKSAKTSLQNEVCQIQCTKKKPRMWAH